MKKPIRSKMTVKASSIHDSTNIYDCAGTHERTTTPPRIFRPLFQTKDSPSLGRRSSELIGRFISRSMSRPISIKAIVFLAILLNAIIGTISGIGSNNTFATTSTLSIAVNDIVSLNLGNTSNGVLVGSTSTTDTTISVNTTNATGYTLKIAASSGTSGTPVPLSNVDTGCTANCIIPSITTSTSTSDANSLTTNTWGYYPSKFNGTTNTVYRPAPTIEGDTLDITSTANASSNSSDNNNYNIAIGAKLDYTNTTPGTYSSAFIVTAIANATPYTITYNANGGTNAPANESSSSYADIVNISSTMPAKTNYTFLGWCEGTSSASNITTTAGVDGCSTTVYNPNGDGTNLSLTIDQTSSSNDIYLYAMWGLNSYTVTANFAGSGVSSVSFTNATYGNANTVSSTGGTTSLKHGVPYTITMNFSSSSYTIDSWATTASGTLGSTTDNPTTYTVTGDATLTVSGKEDKLYFQNTTSADCGEIMYDNRGNDTYKNIAYTTAKIGSLCWMTRNLDLPGGTTLSQSDSNLNGSTTSYTLRASSTSGFNDYTTGWVYNSSSTYNDTSCGDNNPCYSYYSYAAATAGTNPSSGAASSDICPKGWRLPTQAEFNTLKGAYTTGATLTASPFLGVYAGSYNGSSFYSGGGSYGYYWSSTAYNTSNAYYLRFFSSLAGVYYFDKYYGYSVRCVAKS